ncbi:MAG TPA: YqaJ viral recombinase family protein [Terriglobales bacterium]|nr:YqaJ viral recombinase family protein [Terriglobales bacterium]
MAFRRELDQNTPDWLAWRRGGIGASDAPVVMGVSPWMDLETLWLDKTGRLRPAPANGAMRRGQRLEPVARALYTRVTGIEVRPICLEHGTERWMRASFDGLSADGRVALEIKCPGASDHGTALRGCVPAKYVPQVQHLLAVSGAGVCHYWSFRDDEGALVEVAPDPAYIARLIERERAFWRHVVEDRRPGPELVRV